jgi:hypothetical protein
MADNAPLYRAILGAFATSKRQFRLHLRPDDVLAEATWPGGGAGALILTGELPRATSDFDVLYSDPDIGRLQ